MKDRVTNVIIAGVGGQGVLLASQVLAETALLAGLDVKKAEVHGMSQRGGSVISHVRFGNEVFSPLVPEGEGDILLAFEPLEAARYLYMMRRDAVIIMNEKRIAPQPVRVGMAEYPENIVSLCQGFAAEVIVSNTTHAADELGSRKVLNILMLGMLAPFLPFQDDVWLEAIARRVPPRMLELNRLAFMRGHALVKNTVQHRNGGATV